MTLFFKIMYMLKNKKGTAQSLPLVDIIFIFYIISYTECDIQCQDYIITKFSNALL